MIAIVHCDTPVEPYVCRLPGYEPVKNLDKNNAQQAIVLEAVALALALDSDAEVRLLGFRAQRQETLSQRGWQPGMSCAGQLLLSCVQGAAVDHHGHSCRPLLWV